MYNSTQQVIAREELTVDYVQKSYTVTIIRNYFSFRQRFQGLCIMTRWIYDVTSDAVERIEERLRMLSMCVLRIERACIPRDPEPK